MKYWRNALADPWLVATCAFVLVAFGYMEYLAINNWMAGRWYLADVGNLQQALVNTLHGNFMWAPLVETNHYRYHFTPLLTALAPLTLISDYPIPLVTVYTLALACCPLPLYRIAREAGLHGSLRFAVGFLFLTNHFVGSIQLAYHFETLFVLLMLCTIAFAHARSKWPVILSAAGTLMVKEDAALWCGCFAVFLMFQRENQDRARGRWLLLASLGALAIGVGTVWYLGRGSDSNASFYLERAGTLELSWTGLRSLDLLIVSAGGVCLLGGWSALLAAAPAIMLLSSYYFTQALTYYYSYPFIPFLFLALINGTARLLRMIQRSRMQPGTANCLLAIYLICVGAVQFFLPTRTDDYVRLPAPVDPHALLRIHVARNVLPPDVPTVIQFGLWGVTPKRTEAWQFNEKNIQPGRYVFADLQSPYAMPTARYVEIMRDLMDEVAAGKRKLLYSKDEIFVVSPQTGSQANSQ
ncbi:MAG: DUF2079 domain-containing protein [Candidatus Sumerlaeaceae bacterium]